MAVADTFKALGDPVRLEIVRRLSDGLSHTVGSVSHGLDLTRQGVRKHLSVLAKAQLINLESKGRTTEVKLDVDTLEAARSFISEMESHWDRRLEALRNSVEQESQ